MIGNLHKIRRYSITSKYNNLSKNWEKYGFCWEKLNFEHIGNFVHITEFLTLVGKAVKIYINYMMFYQSGQHVK